MLHGLFYLQKEIDRGTGNKEGEGAALSSALCMWLLCNYCRFSVSTVLLHYMKDSYLLCPEGAFLSLTSTISGIKESKSIPGYVLNSI